MSDRELFDVDEAVESTAWREWYFDPNRKGSTFGYQDTRDGHHDAFQRLSESAWLERARRAGQPKASSCDLSDEQLLAIAQEQDYGDEDQKCVLRLMRAVIAADRQCDAQAVGEIVANDPVHGWHMRALMPWNEIGEGTLLYAGLPPRVTQSMVDAQNKILDQLEASRERLDALKEKYGIGQVGARQQAQDKPCGWLAGNASDGGEMMYYRLETAQRECDEHNAYEHSRNDFDEESLRSPEPIYSSSSIEVTVDAARYRWLKERFTGYDFYWGGTPPYDEEKGKCVIVFECGENFNAGRDFEKAIDAALAAPQTETGVNK